MLNIERKMKKSKNIISFILFLFRILNFITVSYYVALKIVAFIVIPSYQIGAPESHFIKEGILKKAPYLKKGLKSCHFVS